MLSPDISKILSGYFDKIFVVTIPRFKDRQERVSERLRGLPFEFFYGQDKEQIDEKAMLAAGEYAPQLTQTYSRRKQNLMKGEIACAISHKNLYKHIIHQGLKRVLVLEDDVVIIEENMQHLKEALAELPENWDLVYLGFLKHEVVTAKLKRKQKFYKLLSSFGMFRWSSKMVGRMLPRPFSSHLSEAGFHDCTHAYGITLNGAKVLLNEQDPIIHRADDLLSYCVLSEKLNGFITRPKFFDQEIYVDPSIGSSTIR